MLHHGIVFPYSATIYRSAFALIAASSICPESFSTSARFNSLEEMGVLSGSNSCSAELSTFHSSVITGPLLHSLC
jgi:hypothetical protein